MNLPTFTGEYCYFHRSAPWLAIYFATSHKTFNIQVPYRNRFLARRRYRRSAAIARAIITAAAFKTDPKPEPKPESQFKAEEVIEVITAAEIKEDESDKLASP
ncbi:hypothetical protein THAR02_10403 [Trichoderma harzianum]|uniref:Uncharacterized protein n=1 Tax=Trichoderma harzianum TaxID=5544 RepID=A0A0F9X9P6_TRIHA|nr:hypothetical protein THAR02_10403 [Trichoderma harzianum]